MEEKWSLKTDIVNRFCSNCQEKLNFKTSLKRISTANWSDNSIPLLCSRCEFKIDGKTKLDDYKRINQERYFKITKMIRKISQNLEQISFQFEKLVRLSQDLEIDHFILVDISTKVADIKNILFESLEAPSYIAIELIEENMIFKTLINSLKVLQDLFNYNAIFDLVLTDIMISINNAINLLQY